MNAKRSPDQTRDTILAAAFDEIHAQGFRGASIENILRRTGVTKGALYHHFPNKTALGYAVVDEVLCPWAEQTMAALRDTTLDPLDTMQRIGREESSLEGVHDPRLGCPVNNLVQEMAGLDEGFRGRLNAILETWRTTIREALERGQRSGVVRRDLDTDAAAAFILAAYEGSLSIAKSSRDTVLFQSALHGLSVYLDSLRTADSASAVA